MKIIQEPRLARHERGESAGVPGRESDASVISRGLWQSEFEVSLTIAQHRVTIVGRIDKGPANGLVSNSVDHNAPDNIHLIVRLQVLRKTFPGADDPTRKKNDQSKCQALDRHTNRRPLRLSAHRRTIGTWQGITPTSSFPRIA